MDNDDLNSKYCENPTLDKLFKDIKFLKFKLDYLKKKIIEEHNRFVTQIVEMEKKEISNKFKSMPQIEKTTSMELRLEHIFHSVQADTELFYYLDTLFIDIKRGIEFLIRLFANYEGFDLGDKFSLENILKHIKPNCKEQASKFEKHILQNKREFVQLILEKEEWLNQLNYRRTRVTHYEIFNKTEGFKIIADWNLIQKLGDEPTITPPELSMFKEPILNFVSRDIKNFDSFMAKVLFMKKDIIKTLNN